MPSSFDGMSGNYMGRSIELAPALFDIYDIVSDRLILLKIIEIFNRIEKEEMNVKIQQQRSAKSSSKKV
jgi:hypothetical protein